MTEQVDMFNPAPAAAMLADAWRSGELLAELPAAIRPRTMVQGYDIQDRFVGNLGQAVAGWKLGVGSKALKRQSGVGRSIAGRVLRSCLYQAADTVLLPNAAPVTVEFEIAYVLGRDVLPDEAEFPVLKAVAETRVAFELVLSRFSDRRAVGWPSFAADNGAFQALVLGEQIEPARIPDLISSLIVSVDGKEAARSVRGEDATDPEAALADLVELARERDMILPRGSIVSTGTVSKPFNFAETAAGISATFLDTEFGFRTLVGSGNGVPA